MSSFKSRASAREAAWQKAAARALNSGQTFSGTLLSRFLILCTRQRWRTVRGRHSSLARMMPGGPIAHNKNGVGQAAPAQVLEELLAARRVLLGARRQMQQRLLAIGQDAPGGQHLLAGLAPRDA